MKPAERPGNGFLDRVALAAYWAVVLCIAWFTVSRAAFGIIDDHGFFNPELLHGHWQLFWGNASGRFYPLNGKEFWLLREAGMLSATSFYAVQGAKLLISAGFVQSILCRFGASRLQASMAGILLLTSPAFLVSVTRLFVPELTALMLFLAMLNFMPGPGDTQATWRLWASLAAATLALYYKEPGFIAVGAMGAVLTPAARRSGARLAYGFGAALLGTAVICAQAYYFLAYRYRGQQDYTAGRQLPLVDVLGFFLHNDMLFLATLAALCGVALLCVRDWRGRGARGIMPNVGTASGTRDAPNALDLQGIRKTQGLWTGQYAAQTGDVLAGASLVAAVVYAGIFLALRITSPWYLLPAYAFVLPALGRALFWVKASWGSAAKAVALVLILVAGSNSLAGGVYFFRFNTAATTGTEALLEYLDRHRPGQGTGKTVLFSPRIEADSEIAYGFSTMLRARGLGDAYECRYGEHEEMWAFLRSASGLVLLTPFTVMSDRELASLGNCYVTLFASPAGVADYSSAGIWPGWLSSPLPWDAFKAGVERLHGNYVLLSGDLAACSMPFDWSRLTVEVSADGLEVCPLGRAEIAMRVTNTGDVPFTRSSNVPEGTVQIVLFSVRPGKAEQPLGVADLPARLDPGESADIKASIHVPGFTPAVLAGCLGSILMGQVYYARDELLFTGHFKPRLGACVQPLAR